MRVLAILAVLTVATNANLLEVEASRACEICVSSIEQVKSVLTDSRVNSVKNAIAMVCGFLPIDGCQEKANAGIDLVVNYVKAVPSQSVCGKFLDCGPEPEPEPVEDTSSCENCKAEYEKIVGFLDRYPQLKPTIKRALSFICVLPIDNCNQIVEEVVDQAFADLEQGADNICKVIRQC